MKALLIHPDEKLLPRVRIDFECPDWREIYDLGKTFYVYFFDYDAERISCRLYFAQNFRESDLGKIKIHFASEEEGSNRYYEAYLLSNFETEKKYTGPENYYIFFKILKKSQRMKEGISVFGKKDNILNDKSDKGNLLFVNCESAQSHTLTKGSVQECIYKDIYNRYNIVNYNLTECRNFIFSRFGEVHLKVFDSFSSLRNKTDFFLFCYMSLEGGLYLYCQDEKKEQVKIFDFSKANGFSFHKSRKSNFMFLKFEAGHMFCQYVIDKTLDFYKDKSSWGKVQYDEFMQRHFYVSNITMLDIENVDISSPEYRNYISTESSSTKEMDLPAAKPINFTLPLFKRNIYADGNMSIYLFGNRLKSNQLCSLNISSENFDGEINNDITTHVIRLKSLDQSAGVSSMISKGHNGSLRALFVFLENKACEKNVCVHITKGMSEFYVDLDLKKVGVVDAPEKISPTTAYLWIQCDKETLKYPQLDINSIETNTFQKACKYMGDFFYVSNQNRYAYKFYKKLFESTDYRVSNESNNIDALRNYLECCKELKKESEQMYLLLRLYHKNNKNIYVIISLLEYCRRHDFFELCDVFFRRGMDEILVSEKNGGDTTMLNKMRKKFYYEYVIYSAYVGNKNIQKEFFFVANHYEYFSEYSSVLYNLKFYKPALELVKTVNISEKMLKYDMVLNSSSSSILYLSNLYVLNKRFVNYVITGSGQYIFNNQSSHDYYDYYGADKQAEVTITDTKKIENNTIESVKEVGTADEPWKESSPKRGNADSSDMLQIGCETVRKEMKTQSNDLDIDNNTVSPNKVKIEPNSIVTVNKCIILNSSFEIMYEKVFETDFLYNRLMHFGTVCEGLEDIRLFCYREQIYFLATMCGKEDLHITLGKYQINQERLCFTKIESEDFALKNVEKNWSFVNIYDKPYLIYSWYPMNILSVDLEKARVKFFTKRDMPQMFSMARGSTNVIDLDDSNKLCMVHYVDYNNNTKRHYYHGFVLLDNNCVLKAYSPPITFFKQPIEYVLGLSYDVMNDQIVCSVSAEDKNSYLCHMLLSKIKELLVYV